MYKEKDDNKKTCNVLKNELVTIPTSIMENNKLLCQAGCVAFVDGLLFVVKVSRNI